jgi:spermidine synthase
MRLLGRQRKQNSNAVEISEKDGVRYLHLGGLAIQSAMRIRDPYALELEYTRAMMMFLVLCQHTESICLIGLGGGSVAKYIHRYLIHSHLLGLEISSEVAAAARAYFLLPEDDERLSVRVEDGAAHIHGHPESCNVLLVDGYDAHRIVEDLASAAFYQACRSSLKPGGVAVFNLWGSDRFFDTYLARIRLAFDDRVLLLPAEQKGNIQVFALTPPEIDLGFDTLLARARQWDTLLNLGLCRFLERMRSVNAISGRRFRFDLPPP